MWSLNLLFKAFNRKCNHHPITTQFQSYFGCASFYPTFLIIGERIDNFWSKGEKSFKNTRLVLYYIFLFYFILYILLLYFIIIFYIFTIIFYYYYIIYILLYFIYYIFIIIFYYILRCSHIAIEISHLYKYNICIIEKIQKIISATKIINWYLDITQNRCISFINRPWIEIIASPENSEGKKG